MCTRFAFVYNFVYALDGRKCMRSLEFCSGTHAGKDFNVTDLFLNLAYLLRLFVCRGEHCYTNTLNEGIWTNV